jgi:hypothetical protein
MLVICTALKFEENISDEKETETEIERLEKKFLNRVRVREKYLR